MDNTHAPGKQDSTNGMSTRKGQSLAEFALILPLLLVLIFGIIEFARLFQSYLVIVNAARFGVRYAVTGNYESIYCSDIDGDDSACDGANKKKEEDQARLLSIYDVVDGAAVAIIRDNSATEGQPGYFDVSVCSFTGPSPAFVWDSDTNTCHPYDYAGDPEEGTTRVLVGVTYEHPLILPIISSWWPSIRLHAERTGILEQFRVARVLGLPPQINVPTPTPAPTFTPTNTATATNTPIPPTPTNTATPTATFTASPTPLPKCEDVEFGRLRL